ncbi:MULTISPECIES: glycosyltransferase family 4 protein [Microbacterium]|uniref:glycosyltransferase family 4 protein n=1 Tax=Microbacterium TaxID=33882 RepID=UPI001E29A44E|nr:glycosyltransferase family 4 protein [Microbacterium sp. oral taxon 186]
MSGAARTHVLIVTGDPIGQQMAGPAIRVWHMARALARVAEVRVVSWMPIGRRSDEFELHYVHETDDLGMSIHEAWSDVIVVQGTSLRVFPSISRTQKIVVADLYDPFQIEQLEMNRYRDRDAWEDEVTKAVSLVNEQLARADCFLCASEAQRNLWLGGLSTLGRLNPANYTADPTFESLVRVVPFGLSDTPPVQTRHAIKGTVPGIEVTDRVLIWGGGIYNWFDPVTLIEAMALVERDRTDVKLFFLSARHFNPDVPEMKALTDAIAAAERLGLTGRTVFFNDTWVDYEARADYLLDADIGVSTHVWHAETRFSFRTRILDYLWAGLPIVASEGDAFADIIGERGLGEVVPAGDAAQVAAAILRLLDDPERLDTVRERVRSARKEFEWDSALAPLIDFCLAPQPAADAVTARTRASARRGSVRGGARGFEAILEMPPGRRRDAALLFHYLRRGGPRLVKEKMAERRERHDRESI